MSPARCKTTVARSMSVNGTVYQGELRFFLLPAMVASTQGMDRVREMRYLMTK